MADVFVEDGSLVVRLSPLERAESLHGGMRVPRDEIASVEVLEHPVDAVGGWKLVGARLTGSYAIGTFVVDGRRVFAVVHRDTGRGVRVRLSRGSFYELVIGCDDPEAVVASLAAK